MVLPADGVPQHGGGLLHRVRAMGDHDAVFLRAQTMLQDQPPVVAGHLKAVDHHQRADVDLQMAAAEMQHLGDMRVLEVQLAGELVVFLVEGSPGGQDSNSLRVH